MTDNPIFFGSSIAPITADGDSSTFLIERGGDYNFDVSGTFGGASVQLKSKSGGHSNYQSIGSAVTAAQAPTPITIAKGDTVKVTTSSATGTTSLIASLNLVRQF